MTMVAMRRKIGRWVLLVLLIVMMVPGGNHGDLNHDDGLQAEEMVVRGSLAKEELEQHYSVY